VPLLFAVAVLTFALIELAPGDPIVALAGEDGDAAYYADDARALRLDRPLGSASRSTWAGSRRATSGTPTACSSPPPSAVLGRLPATLLLIAPALLLAVVIGWRSGCWPRAAPLATDTA
jgi:peptide/nickel transport system permease protein